MEIEKDSKVFNYAIDHRKQVFNSKVVKYVINHRKQAGKKKIGIIKFLTLALYL